jgi:hypothetical protein
VVANSFEASILHPQISWRMCKRRATDVPSAPVTYGYATITCIAIAGRVLAAAGTVGRLVPRNAPGRRGIFESCPVAARIGRCQISLRLYRNLTRRSWTPTVCGRCDSFTNQSSTIHHQFWYAPIAALGIADMVCTNSEGT